MWKQVAFDFKKELDELRRNKKKRKKKLNWLMVLMLTNN